MVRKKNLLFIVFFGLVLISCNEVKYFNYEVNQNLYTELRLKSKGVFEEYIYFNVEDTVISDDFGNVISGNYEYSGDTLLLYYKDADQKKEAEIYIKKGLNLVKLEPITYSHHFLNMIYISGKSEKLRDLPNYTTIIWKEGL